MYRDAEDLISVGAYVEGSNPEIDAAVEKMPALNRFLTQAVEERYSMTDTLKALGELAAWRYRRRSWAVRRFRFRLERLLELRAHREQEALYRLAEAAGHCVRLARRIQELGQERGAAYRSVPGQTGSLDLGLFAYRERYLAWLESSRRRLKAELAAREKPAPGGAGQVPGGRPGAQGAGEAEGAQGGRAPPPGPDRGVQRPGRRGGQPVPPGA